MPRMSQPALQDLLALPLDLTKLGQEQDDHLSHLYFEAMGGYNQTPRGLNERHCCLYHFELESALN